MDPDFPARRRNPLHPGIAGVGALHLGRLVSVSGTVVRAGEVRAMEGRRVYRCARCGYAFPVRADVQGGGGFEARLPLECPSSLLPREERERWRQLAGGDNGGGGRGARDRDGGGPCLGSTFVPVPPAEANAGADPALSPAALHTNHQELRVQEAARCLDLGAAPASLLAVARDELADACQPGGELFVCV
jgi:DNA helicase MCM9